MRDTRHRILETARDLFLQHGLDGLKLRRVADQVGISATAIYRHFENKNELLKHVVDFGRERLVSALSEIYEPIPPRERIRIAFEAYLEFGMTYPHDYKIIFLSWDQLQYGVHSFDYDGTSEGEFGPHSKYVMEQFAQCLPHDRRSDEDCLDAFMMVWAQCHGLVSSYLVGGLSAVLSEAELRCLYSRVTERVIAAVLDEP